ncbi:unnamed protein product [Auanema sp. JU1783]|nr:unnamed protein product [Auanema sp. JU1783]
MEGQIAGKGDMDDLDEFFLDDINLRTPPHRPEHTTQNGDYQRPADFVHFNDAVPVNAASPLDPNYQQQPNQPQQQQETIADAGAVPHPHNHPNPTKGSIGLQNAEADLSREDPMAAETEAAVFHMIASEVNEVSEMIPDEPTSSSVSRNQFVSFESAAANERSSTQPMETYNTENRVVANNNKTVSLASPQSTDKHIGSLFSTSRMGEIANTVADIEMALFGELLIDKNKKKAASQQDIKTNEIIPNKTEVSAEDVHVDLPQQKELSGAKNSVFEKDPLLLNLSGDQIVETSKGGLDTSAEIKERNTTEPENEEVRFDSPPDIDTVESNNCNVLKRSHDRKKNSLTDEPSSSQCDNSKALIPYKPKLQFNSSEIMQTYSPDGKPTNQIILKIRAKIPHKKETDPKLFNGEPVTIHQSDSCEENGCNTTKHVKDTGFCETEKVEEVKNPINDDGADNHKNSRQVQQETADINKSKASVLYEEFDSGQEQPQTLDENLSKKEKMKSSKNYENGKVQTEPIEQSKPDNLEENTCEDDNTAGCVKSKLWGTETKQDELTGEKTEGETGMSLEEKKKKERDMEKWHHEISNHIRTWRREKLLETSSGYVDLFNKAEEQNGSVSDMRADDARPSNDENSIEKSNKLKMRKSENDKKTEVPSRRVSDVKVDVVKPRKEEKFMGNPNKVKMRTLENDKKTEVPSRRVSDVKADVVKPRKEEKFIEKSNKVKMRISENKKKKEVPLVKTHKPFRPKISLHEDSRSKAKWKKSSFFKEKKEFRKKKTNKPKRRIVYIEEDWEEEQNEKKRQEAEKAKKENENDDDVWTEEDERNLQAFLSLREPDEPGYGLVPMQNHSMSPCGVEDTKADGENDIAHKKRKLTTIDDSPFKALLSMDETELSDLLFVLPEIDGNSFQRLDVTRYDRLLHGYDSPAPTLSLEPLIIKALENTEEGKAMKGTIVEYVISNHNFPIPIRKVDKLLGKCLLEMVVHSVLFQLNSTGLRGFFFLDDPRSGFILPAGTYGYGPGR